MPPPIDDQRTLDGFDDDDPAPEGLDEKLTIGTELEPVTTGPPPPAVPVIPVSERPARGDFELREVIGEGAMGRVHLAFQRSVGREVAIKVPRPGPGHGARIQQMVREARVTGRLEHPHIVPMHGLGRTADGSTVMVMKRIEGVSWRAVVDGREAMPERFRSGDPIESHLRILMDVCDAVAFAHERGILHRDLKLDNVMLGAWGEVYVVDWGLAVALVDDGTGHLPLAAEVRGVAGTPGYMAPEMAQGEGALLGPASDVFCLGALLHRLLVGRPRNDGRTLVEALARARQAAPFDYSGLGLPGELTAICARATAARPVDRYPDVASLRRALAESLQRRASSALVEQAMAARAAMQAVDGDRDALERHFGAARFALEHALRVWPDNPTARRALDGLLLDRAERALDAEGVDYAEQLVEAASGFAFGPRRDALRARVVEGRARQRALRELPWQHDLAAHGRRRGILLIGLATFWCLNNLRRALNPPTVEQLLLDQVAMLLVIGGLIVALRRWLWSTHVNRQIARAIIGFIAIDTTSRFIGWSLGLDAHTTTSIELAVDFAGLLLCVMIIDLRMWPGLAVFVSGAIYGLTHVEHAFFAKGITMLVGLGGTGVVWMLLPSQSEPRAPAG